MSSFLADVKGLSFPLRKKSILLRLTERKKKKKKQKKKKKEEKKKKKKKKKKKYIFLKNDNQCFKLDNTVTLLLNFDLSFRFCARFTR